MPRVLLILPTASYRAPDFLEAARRLGVEVTVASESSNVLESARPEGYLELDLSDPSASAARAAGFSRAHPLQAVLGVDDATAELAASIARDLGLAGNPPEAARRCRDKRLMRESLRQAGLPVPGFKAFPTGEDPERIAPSVRYPCVLKPTTLAASQGVVRADDPAGFSAAFRRVRAIVSAEGAAPEMLVEDFVPGPEFALEGIIEEGSLRTLAIFDKPDPLDGPFFEETLYVRPSRLKPRDQRRLSECAARAAAALGLVTGPVHAELRLNDRGPWVIELAARPIGGRCSRALRFGAGLSLEELVIRQALGLPTEGIEPDPSPSGVMMIPIPGAGILREVRGIEDAKSVPGISEVLVLARPGARLVPLPEGSAYPGFVFCRAETPERVESALRQAHGRLEFVLDPSGEGAGAAEAPRSGSCRP